MRQRISLGSCPRCNDGALKVEPDPTGYKLDVSCLTCGFAGGTQARRATVIDPGYQLVRVSDRQHPASANKVHYYQPAAELPRVLCGKDVTNTFPVLRDNELCGACDHIASL